MKKYVNKISFLLGLIGFCVFQVEAQSIAVIDYAIYQDTKKIKPKIKRKCDNLGKDFSNYTQNYLTKYKWDVQQAEVLSKEGLELKLEIVDLSSIGNPFIGHYKSVEIEAMLYRDGELLDTYSNSKESRGGLIPSFQSSCDVLKMCVKSLGKDIAKWIKKKKI